MGKSGLSIDAITHGVSSEGVEALLKEIRLEMIDKAIAGGIDLIITKSIFLLRFNAGKTLRT